LNSILQKKEPSIVIVYGRRRIGKTFFIEQHLANRNLIKIEGIQGLSEKEQLQQATKQLQSYWNDATLKKVKIENWNDFFEIIHEKTKKTKVYFIS
jgi:AAA+ ATPase superfamily predicted ATPase